MQPKFKTSYIRLLDGESPVEDDHHSDGDNDDHEDEDDSRINLSY